MRVCVGEWVSGCVCVYVYVWVWVCGWVDGCLYFLILIYFQQCASCPPSYFPLTLTLFTAGNEADVDLKSNNNLLVLIKLNILQGDTEEIVKVR